MKKKTPIRKVSKNPTKKLKDTADRALQDWMRRTHEGFKCEYCSGPFEVSHHFIEKSRSSRLRYDERNLVKICHKCHFGIHRASSRALFDLTIREQRGKEWADYIIKSAREYLDINSKKYLTEIIDKYK